jgi:hypothetical protein
MMTVPTAQLDPRIRTLLARLRWRIRGYVWLEGLAVSAIWLGLTFWIGLALDYLPVLVGASEMPRAARAVMLVIITAVLAVLLYRWVLRRVFVPLADRNLAVILERRFAGFRDSLVTAVELTETPDHAESFDQDMLGRTSQDALLRIHDVRLSEVFNFWPLLLAVLGAGALLFSVAAFCAFNQEGARIWAQRLYLLRDEAWPRQALVEVVGVELLGSEDAAERVQEPPLIPFRDGVLKVAKGSNLRLQARADLGAKVVPQACTVHYRSAEGERGRVTMNRSQRGRGQYQNYSFAGKPLRGILSSLRFDVVGYDFRVRDFQIEVVDSPAVTGVQLECVFPEYLVDQQLGSWLPRTIDWTSATQLPRGTDVTIRVHTNKPLQRVDLYNPETHETVTLTIAGNGDARKQFVHRVKDLRENLTLDVTLCDADNVLTERPYRVFVTAIPDEAPRVDIALQGIGSAVTPDVNIPIRGRITDDYAVGKTWFDAELLPAAIDTSEQPRSLKYASEFRLAKAGQADAALDFRELRAAAGGLELRPKDKLLLTVKATDKFNLGDVPNEGHSDRYQLEVVTPDQLLSMLEAREIGLRQRFEQIIEEVRQARDLLNRVAAPTTDRGAEPEDAAGAEPRPAPSGDSAKPAPAAPVAKPASSAVPPERRQSLRLLRAQQSLQQARKSAQEVLGVAASFRDLREELINNRVDTEDRKQRLQELIAEPLQLIGETMFPELQRRLEVVEQTLLADLTAKRYDVQAGTPEANAALQQANDVLAELEKVLQHMLDLETFNELLDIVRQLMKDQEKLIEETGKERQKGLLQDLK